MFGKKNVDLVQEGGLRRGKSVHNTVQHSKDNNNMFHNE